MIEHVQKLIKAGISVMPTGADKAPSGIWKQYQDRIMTSDEARRGFVNGARLAVIGGMVSGNLEITDIDNPNLFQPLMDLIHARNPSLAQKLYIEKSPNGRHLAYRCESPVSGNTKLAVGVVEVEGPGEWSCPWKDESKKYKARQIDGKWVVEVTAIETRGEGGYCLVAPSTGYSQINGTLLDLAVLTTDEIEIIHTTARTFDQRKYEKFYQQQGYSSKAVSPGTEFNKKTSIAGLLMHYGWKPDRRTSAGQGWTRPGKEKGVSGVLLADSGNFYVWSSNAAPLEPERSYDAFAFYSFYEHGGDFSAAARQLVAEGYGPAQGGESGERGEKQKIPINVKRRIRGERGRKLSEKEISALLDAAKKTDVLKPETESTPVYPVEALGVLADPCRAIVSEGQVSLEVAGQCLLGTAALLVQSVADVRTLAGVKPCSLSLITIAESGEGKSTAEEAALRPVNAKQRIEGSEYREQVSNKKSDNVITEPFRIMRDGTAEGIRRSFREGRPSQGCFTSEAAVMLSGYGMSAEHRGKTAANLNSLWDSGEISVARGTDTRLQLYDRRLSIHWLIQPDIAYQAVHDPMLSSVGFWPRFLLAYPAPTPPLKAKIFRPGQHKAIVEYWGRCNHFLEQPMGESCSGLPVIESNGKAQEMVCRYYELMQQEGKRGALTEVKPFALRATEQAFRIAGVLAAFSGAMEIDEQAMKNGITLASYSIDSWLSIFCHDEENAAIKWALLLYKWILKQEGQKATTTAILRIATPKGLRSRDRRDTAIALLAQAGLVFQERDTVYATCEGVEL